MGLIPTFTFTTSQEAIIIVIAVAYAIFAVVVQRKLSNAKRLREIQAQISKISKEMNKMMKEKVPEAQIMAKQKEMMPLLGESMRSSMKPMFVILPLFLVVYYVLVPQLPLGAPATPKTIQQFFFLVVFVVGLISAVVMMIYDRTQTKKMEKELDSEKPASDK
ncbi:MAG: DUF106 domain-containing protein [Candidatus Micrarchaeota archaeon]|nr:DUF106 domain-containing protein [Candidatus Micrarchaeota archaeon]